MSHLCTDNFIFEKMESNATKLESNTFKITVKKGDKFIFDKDLSKSWFYVVIPVLILLTCVFSLINIGLVLFTPVVSPSYEETTARLQNKQGYLDSLSTSERNKLLSKKDNLPLGL